MLHHVSDLWKCYITFPSSLWQCYTTFQISSNAWLCPRWIRSYKNSFPALCTNLNTLMPAIGFCQLWALCLAYLGWHFAYYSLSALYSICTKRWQCIQIISLFLNPFLHPFRAKLQWIQSKLLSNDWSTYWDIILCSQALDFRRICYISNSPAHHTISFRKREYIDNAWSLYKYISTHHT